MFRRWMDPSAAAPKRAILPCVAAGVLALAALPPAGAVLGLVGEPHCGGHVDTASADCIFSCATGDTITVAVTADDKSTWVANVYAIGHVKCGDSSAQCREKDECYADDVTTSPSSSGTCHGETDEWWHDGFSYGCTASKGGEEPALVCRLLPAVCDAQGVETPVPDCAMPAEWEVPEPDRLLDRAGVPSCDLAASPASPGARAVRASVHVVVRGDEALARVCHEDLPCRFAIPRCTLGVEGRIRACDAGAGSLLLAPDFQAPGWFPDATRG